MEEQNAKFIDTIKEVRINIPLVDVVAGMPNYEKFLKDLVSNKRRLEQIYVAFFNEVCPTVIQNKLPLKLGDPGSFLIPCTLGNSVTCDALADLSASINLIVAENMLIQVGQFIFLLEFVILKMEEDSRVPIILGRPFLHTTDAIICVKGKELNLGVRDDRISFQIKKAMQHSHSNDDTCFSSDVVDEVMEGELYALLNDSEPFMSTSENINEIDSDKEFKEFMVVEVKEILAGKEETDDNF
ncbi:reverse transcriptase domain-containing protein [Tanacetum coccineum]